MSTVQSVERAFAILSVLSAGPLPLTDLAEQTMLPKSTVARLLHTLEALEAVEREHDGWRYRIGPRLDELARPVDSIARLVRIVMPHLQNLTTALGEASGLAVAEGYNAHFVAQIESPNPVQIRDYTGSWYPMHVTPAGIVLMAEWPREEISRYLQRPLEAFTSNTLVDPEQIHKRLEETREQGYAWAHEEFAEGIASVAAPVRDGQGRTVAAMSAHGPAYRFPPYGRGDDIGELVRDAAAHVHLS